MTDKEVKKLKRAELLEMLIEQTEENERLHTVISDLEAKLAQRVVMMEEAGSIAEASMRLTNVFAEAQESADRYLESIRARDEASQAQCAALEQEVRSRCEQIAVETKRSCQQQEQESRQKCDEMLRTAEEECNRQRQELEEQRAELEAMRAQLIPQDEAEPEPIEQPRRRWPFGRK